MLCFKLIGNRACIPCLDTECDALFHMICLAVLFLEPGQYIPIEGGCPKCLKRMSWGNLIRKKNGYNKLELKCKSESNCANDELIEIYSDG